ncbi:sensor histidine kinase [Flavobacterium sp.]|uniref:sensor histidine kinase n=1 Tax=Flavobacterium sp. TaxID=239 RepID=UPI0026077879|nr:sensor histidine kinase [Flavobacterium sp.]
MLLNNQHEEHQKELLSTQIEIQNQTMQHIGREIHDNIGQKLTLASLYTQQLAYENKAPQITESIENISAIINQSLSELRALSKSLTDDSIDSLSLVELIQSECEKVNELKKCKVTFKNNEDAANYNYQIKSVLLRICQEFMQNSIKHSKCKNINIILMRNNDHLSFILADDGKGFDVDKKSNGIGLLNMKKRTEIIGGKASIQSSTSSGTQLTISIPL